MTLTHGTVSTVRRATLVQRPPSGRAPCRLAPPLPRPGYASRFRDWAGDEAVRDGSTSQPAPEPPRMATAARTVTRTERAVAPIVRVGVLDVTFRVPPPSSS